RRHRAVLLSHRVERIHPRLHLHERSARVDPAGGDAALRRRLLDRVGPLRRGSDRRVAAGDGALLRARASPRRRAHAGRRQGLIRLIVLAMSPSTSNWPALPLASWRDTYETLHMFTQIVGKLRLGLCPPQNQYWHVPLYVTVRGLTTSPMPYEERTISIDFDFIDHALVARSSDGRTRTL